MSTKNTKRLILFIAIFGISWNVFAQKPLNTPIERGPKSKIELIRADSLVGDNLGAPTRTFYGNVRFLHRGVYLNCQKAIHNAGTNNLIAYGKIFINQGDTLTITGDTLYYDGNTRLAEIHGKKVVLKDKQTVLESRRLDYNLNRDLAYYPFPGIIYQDSVTLSSNSGYYNTSSKVFNYYGNVEILHTDFVLCTDTLYYDSNSKRADFKSPTTITSDDGILKAREGYYFTDSKKSRFYGRSFVENEKYTLEADTLDFDMSREEGFGIGNVEFFMKSDSLFLNGDYGEKRSDQGFTKLSGNALMRSVSKSDTLFLSADFIIAFNSIDSVIHKNQNLSDSLSTTDSTHSAPPLIQITSDRQPNDSTGKDKIEFLIADKNVKVYRNDFQALCDSLNYNLVDSVITFIRKPIIWSNDNQLEGDTIEVYMKNDKINTMFLRQRSFVIAQDSVSNFNQIKGREIIAFFDEQTSIRRVEVEGNGESIYYALDDSNKIIGLNRVECSKMTLNFINRKVKRISFLGNPDSRLIPPVEINSNDMQLEGFDWKILQKPTKKDVLGNNYFTEKEQIQAETESVSTL
jgi:lipopolysaccharide export system protein LptA